MKKLLMPTALVLCLATVLSCKKAAVDAVQTDPVIINSLTDFSFESDPADPFKFTFKNLSLKHKKTEWRFGDDTLSIADNPVHVYLSTGKFSVDVRTYSATGAVSRKLAYITIVPDIVIKITGVKTDVANQVKFGIISKSPVASVLWTFNDVSPGATSALANPVRTYGTGSFTSVTAKVTTTSGSVVSLTKNVSTEGMAQEITQGRASYTVSAENTLNSVEDSRSLLDGNLATKYTMGGKDLRLFTYPLIITVNYNTAQAVKVYAIANSNDNPPRDPKAWTIQGSNDGITWDILDTRIMTKNFYDQMTALGATTDPQRYMQLFYYAIANPKPYTKYRWVISANWGDAALQVNEWRLYK